MIAGKGLASWVKSLKVAPDRIIAFGLAAAIGSAIWMATVTDFPGDEFASIHPFVLVVTIIVLAAVMMGLGMLFPCAVKWLSGGLAFGPLLLAPFSASRGDNDGLWTFVFLYILGIAFAFSVPAFEGALIRMRSRKVPIEPGERKPVMPVELIRVAPKDEVWNKLRRKPLQSSAAALVLVGALTLWILSRWPNPWTQIEAVLDQFPRPDAFTVVETRREGHRLYAGSPRVMWKMQTDLPRARACTLLADALRVWTGSVQEEGPGLDPEDAEVAKTLERCSFFTRLPSGKLPVDGFAQHSDGTVSGLTMIVLWVGSP